MKPSKIKSEYWVQVENPNPIHDWTARSGKWLIFVPLNKLDEKWTLIAQATISCELGIAAKAATAKPNSLSKNKFTKVICVYTYDSLDKDDVFRVRDKLDTLGFTNKLFYKTDQATSDGKYSSSEGIRISLYCR